MFNVEMACGMWREVMLSFLQADALPGKYLTKLASLFVDGIKSGNTHSGKYVFSELLLKL